MEKAMVVGTGDTATLNRELNQGWTVKLTERFMPFLAIGGQSSRYEENAGHILVILEKKSE